MLNKLWSVFLSLIAGPVIPCPRQIQADREAAAQQVKRGQS